MTKRLEIIFDNLPACKVFADIGCDHGYIAKAMIENGKCQKFIVADISKSCLNKAENLLKDYINSGVGQSVVSNGFEKVSECDLALIAGMGGEEIIGIINRAKCLPRTLVLQPMKNVDKVRELLVEKGYEIQKDFVFFASGKFYDLIVASVGKDHLTQDEIYFGRTNLIEKGKAFRDRNLLLVKKLQGYLQKQDLSCQSRQKILLDLEKLSKYV